MAKISPSSIKYSIVAEIVAEGPFQKPDVIGALFGQTEGLLGSEMELRELQKDGKIGRIEVNIVNEDGKVRGEIIIPSALDKTETTIIAASIETIDKVGPTDAKITIKDIEDVRGNKRDYIMERAKQLLAGIKNEGMDSREMENELRESGRVAKIVSYGPEGLAAGPEMESSDEIIVVEGRADVVNMLKYGFKNVVGMQGAKFPKSITTLSETKEITLFVDGDRGGNLIAQNVFDNAKLAYIAQAPDGKEVEELTGKEIHQALRKKVIPSVFLKNDSLRDSPRRSYERSSNYRDSEKSISEEVVGKRELTDNDRAKIRELSDEIKGRNVVILNDKLESINNVPVSRLSSLRERDAFVLLTSNASSSVIYGAEKLHAKAVAAKTFGKIPETKLELISI